MSVASDVRGNRVTKGSNVSYGWDVLNRMTSYTSGSITTSYEYRADGMRVSKSDSTGSAVYRYDGQMCVQDVETTSSSTIVNDYALGARGVDAVSKTDSSGTNVGYPLYDGHGNRVATLTKSGSSFALGDLRSYDAWGNVATGGSTGRPRGRYVANLGHVQDDESGLVYMRARYYEPGSGRFVSEDPARDGMNWFSYVRNDPVNMIDRSGRSAELAFAAAHILAATIGSYLGQEAAHRIIEAWIQAGLAARQNGFSEDAMDFMMAYHSSDFVNACKGGMAGLLGLAFTALGEVPAGLVGASTMGSVGLTFAVAFAMNFLYATLNDMAAMVLIDIAEGE